MPVQPVECLLKTSHHCTPAFGLHAASESVDQLSKIADSLHVGKCSRLPPKASVHARQHRVND